MAAGGMAGATGQDAQANPAQLRQAPVAPRVYSVINLGPDTLGAFLNERGHAAFSSFVYYTSSFFDGERNHEPGSPDAILIRGLNNRGTITA